MNSSDRRFAIAGIVVAVIMGMPGWLPVFGVSSNMLTELASSSLYKFVPVFALVLGLLSGFILARKSGPITWDF